MEERYRKPEILEESAGGDASARQDRHADPDEPRETPENKVRLVVHGSETEREDQPPAEPYVRDRLLGTLLGNRYRMLNVIGKGATSCVYRAEDERLHRLVAIKILHAHLIGDQATRKRFNQEVTTAELLQHPNIVAKYDSGETEDDQPYLVLEYVEGMSLSDAIRAAGWLPVSRGIPIFLQICAALAAAHNKGITHRDLKPANIVLAKSPDGSVLVKVLDFGIAKVVTPKTDATFSVTQTGETLGSLLYMSPEQCLDQELDGRSDCYSLGCLMYETLTGKPPLSAKTAFETMNRQISEMPEPLTKVRPDVTWPRGLQEIIFKSLAKDPKDRYQNISMLQDALQAVVNTQPEQHDNQQLRKIAAMQGLTLLAVVIALIAFLYFQRATTESRATANANANVQSNTTVSANEPVPEDAELEKTKLMVERTKLQEEKIRLKEESDMQGYIDQLRANNEEQMKVIKPQLELLNRAH